MWLLAQPPERGGLGFSPSEVKRLTPEEAIFYLASEDRIKSSCRKMDLESRGLTAKDAVREHRARMAEMRKFYTGKAEL